VIGRGPEVEFENNALMDIKFGAGKSFIPNAVWFGSYKRTIVANFIDGIVYGLITGAIFAWRCPY
jgi:hypothetical protein